MKPTRQLHDLGQSLWLDNITRELLDNGTLHRNLITIETRTGASGTASRCRLAGWGVAEINHLSFGGTCALRRCDPKKVLVGVAQAIDHSRGMRGKGILPPLPVAAVAVRFAECGYG